MCKHPITQLIYKQNLLKAYSLLNVSKLHRLHDYAITHNHFYNMEENLDCIFLDSTVKSLISYDSRPFIRSSHPYLIGQMALV